MDKFHYSNQLLTLTIKKQPSVLKSATVCVSLQYLGRLVTLI